MNLGLCQHPSHVSEIQSSTYLFLGLEVGPGGPGGKCHHQGSGAPHDMWRGGTKVPLSTGLGGPLQNPSSGEISSPGGGFEMEPEDAGSEVPDPSHTVVVAQGAYHGVLEDVGPEVFDPPHRDVITRGAHNGVLEDAGPEVPNPPHTAVVVQGAHNDLL